jgi:glycosyltransferase involved in cell wall biosynthesis
MLPIKLVTSIHGADIFPKGKPRAGYSAALRFLLRSSDLIVANSQAFRRDFLTLFSRLSDKTIAIHNGVDLAEFNGAASSACEANGRRYLLSIAAHNEKKSLDVLIRAFADIARTDPELELFLVGDGPLRKQLEQLARSLSLDARVRFLGRQDRPAIAKLLHGCELFVLPSKSEPFGIVVLEALACRKPVVATNTGGIPEIIESGANGILVEPEQPAELARAISRVLADRNLGAAVAERGYATVEKQFRWENTGTAYEAAFANLAAHPA